MTDTQNQIHVKQFKDDIIQAVQQKNSRLDGTVRRRESIKAEEFFFHKLAAINLLEKTERFSPTPFIDPQHSRRKLVPKTFHGAFEIDDFDEDRSIITGLQSDYVMALKNAAMRRKDTVIIEAATADAFEGKDGTIAVPFPTANIIVAGGVGLTTPKLLDAMKIIKSADVDPEEKLYCPISAEQERNLMDDDKIINADFTAGRVLDRGIIGSWGNINFIHSERLTKVGTDRQVLLYTEQALGLGIARDITIKIGEDPGKSFTKVLYIKLDLGATRIEDEKIVRIDCLE